MRRNVIGWPLLLWQLPLLLASSGCAESEPRVDTGGGSGAASPPAVFREVAVDTGLDFVHFNGMSGERYLVEHMGPGAALFDFDNDGDLDVYLLQGHMLGPGKTLEQATLAPTPGRPLIDRLYRNDLQTGPDGVPNLRFSDVTAESGIHAAGYGMGVASGDYDNDGNVDLYVTNWGANQLWRNNGDGTFRDATAEAGVADDHWSTSAAFVDYDADGWLDLVVVNYLEFDYPRHLTCPSPASQIDYCGPQAYRGQADRLFRNNGDGTFEDRSRASGVGAVPGKSLGVVTADFDGDGRIDLYVARDKEPNALWINQADGTFRDDALVVGCALNAEGRPEAGMGVDAGDFDGDGDEDIFLSHLTRETNTIYVNDAGVGFDDRSGPTGLGPPSWNETGWGTSWFDYDNDGWLDLFVANGAISIIEAQARAGDPFPLRQVNRLFRNGADGRFEDVTDRAGAALAQIEVSRGAAFGDIDNDGDTDVLVVNNSGPVRLLRNDVGSRAAWLGLRLLGATAPRDMQGARVEVVLPDGRSLWRWAGTDGSYCSAGDPRILVGLGAATAADRIRVRWPDGTAEEWPGPGLNRYVTLRQAGAPSARSPADAPHPPADR